jgi:hypothetical protein
MASARKRKFPYHPESAQEIRFLGKIGFLKPCPRCPRNPIFGKNFSNRAQGAQEIRFLGKISQTVPKVPKKSDFWENRISQTVPKVPKNPIFWKNRISQPCPRYPRNPIFGKNRISQTVCPNVPKKSDFWEKSDFSNRVPKRTQEIRFFWKSRISKIP